MDNNPQPGSYEGYWFIEINQKKGELLIERVACATWFEQLGQLQFVEVSPNVHTCVVDGKNHIALSVTVGSYGPGFPTWVAHIRRNPDWPITPRQVWFRDELAGQN